MKICKRRLSVSYPRSLHLSDGITFFIHLIYVPQVKLILPRDMSKSKARGYYVERKLVQLLSKKEGNYVFRIPVSGSRAPTKLDTAFPDIFLVNNREDRIVAFEVKGTSRRKIKVRKEQIAKLARFLEPFKKYKNREAVVAVWFFKRNKWVFKLVDTGLLCEDLIISDDEESTWFP